MITTAVIESIELLDVGDAVGQGDASFFVGVRAAGHTGWYGPIYDRHARYIERHLAGRLVGCSPFEHRQSIERLQEGSGSYVDQRCHSWSVGALDCAVWDLHGKLFSMPVADLLAVRPRPAIPAYASWLRLDLTSPDALSAVEQVSAEGWVFTKWGLRRVLGDAEKLAALAGAVSQRAAGQVAFDALQTWSVDLTFAFSRWARRVPIVWLEDPISYHDMSCYTQISMCGIPIAAGESFIIGDIPFGEFRPNQLRALTVDVVGIGGITKMLELVRMARDLRVQIVPHGRSLMPAIQLAAAYSDVVPIVEYQLQWEQRRQNLYADGIVPESGRIRLPSTTGLGIDPRRDLARNRS
ncbi:mandelate racemase/muconate lactonizing enzyme family protein [Nocardia sp. NPDC004068]|uniref:mandelate racemase/muconate lactonizing enzyme family protein n=1 Tax=Nocardia sp. NPDC004068 TaxID=3364303 RepID=UPI0036A610DA